MAVQITVRKTWLAIAGVLLILAIVLGATGAYWLWKNLGAELLLRDQQAKVSIPEPMAVGIDILDSLDIELDTVKPVAVSVDAGDQWCCWLCHQRHSHQDDVPAAGVCG